MLEILNLPACPPNISARDKTSTNSTPDRINLVFTRIPRRLFTNTTIKPYRLTIG